MEYYKYKHSVCNDAKGKDKSSNNDQWSIGTIVILGESMLNHIVEE